jgi:hypothetical protein
MNDKKEVAVMPETAVVQSPIEVMRLALENNVDLEKVEKMIELQAKWDAMEAKKAYHLAMATFKKNPPTILKDKTVGYKNSDGSATGYNHASLGNVTKEINSSLSKHGFSAAWKMTQPDNNVEVTCTITHKLGHSESTSIKSPADTSGKKNPIQAIASTVTYLERYTLLALTGLATHDQDDDGVSAGSGIMYITTKEKQIIIDMIADANADVVKFLKCVGCESVDEIPSGMFKAATTILTATKKLKGKSNDNS